jgi:hypothetical protein
MELFRSNSEVQRFVIIEGDVIHGYLAITSLLFRINTGIASLIREMSGKRVSVIDSINCIYKAVSTREAL